jgi:two-component system response regulator MprA
LVVDDDPATRSVLHRSLIEEGFRVDAVADAASAADVVTREAFDAIVLDVVLPDENGLSVCRRLRSRGIDTPILLLSGRTRTDDRVRGLDAGADDFVAKPFELDELFARLRALTRRGRSRHLSAVLKYGPIELNQTEACVRVDGVPVALTVTEFQLLEFFLRRAEAVVTRQDLAQHVWAGAVEPESNVIEVYVGYLRRKLGAAGALLRTIRGAGYTLGREHL